MLRSLVGSEMCIRDRYQRRVRDVFRTRMATLPEVELAPPLPPYPEKMTRHDASVHAVPVADPALEEMVPLTALDDAIARKYQKSSGGSALHNIVLVLLVIAVAVLLFREFDWTPIISGGGHVKTPCPQCDCPTCPAVPSCPSCPAKSHAIPPSWQSASLHSNQTTVPLANISLKVNLHDGTSVVGNPSLNHFGADTLIGAANVSWEVAGDQYGQKERRGDTQAVGWLFPEVRAA
eukprot:TRINITY_DN10376_c0_g1_i1.p1 TRINITY_DN10376_c0_g1~~TRINITY_DN10376_c0_g1_i1.p1  ORF type:complete len:235 (-),score=55.20 TRINITY_DN10376_c0_g1_i1:478-1182(-)